MTETLVCPQAKCGFEAKKRRIDFVFRRFSDLPCPNCGMEDLSRYENNHKNFKCNSCGCLWQTIPCPRCGTELEISKHND